MKLKVSGNSVTGDGIALSLELPVEDARLIGETVVVIHDCSAYPDNGPSANLVAYTIAGEPIWAVQNLTTSSPTDYFVNFISEDPLIVFNFESFACHVELSTGKILDTEFTK